MPNRIHDRLITSAAKLHLGAIGCKQKGRSRIWLDDQVWRLTVIEFQPSSWQAGSYLNVGTMWLWDAKDYWSFDVGHRIGDFHPFKDEAQFSHVTGELARQAATEVLSHRQKFDSIESAAAYLLSKEKVSSWDHYHAAMACLLLGHASDAKSELESLLQKDPATSLRARVAELLGIPDSLQKQTVIEEITRCRSLLKLQPKNV